MCKFITIVLVFIAVFARAQQASDFQLTDSLTYQYFIQGDWDNVITTGTAAIKNGLDYKHLRQRIGYAYFSKGDFYSAQKYYLKALEFDKYDALTMEYLYYCGINTGNSGSARLYAQKLPEEVKKILKIKSFQPIQVIDLEYNYKFINSDSRTDPSYMRFGINTLLGYRLSLYQSVSNYQQTVNGLKVKQSDYYALVNAAISSHFSASVAYHYLNTTSDGLKYPGKMAYISLNSQFNRFSLGLNGSVLKMNNKDFLQLGLQAGVVLPGKPSLYFKSSLSGVMESQNQHIVFAQHAGMKLFRTCWAEGNITLGKLQNYHDHHALYVYNSVDPTLFRTGLTLFWYLGRSLIFTTNYTFDTKQIENIGTTYNQHSISGGITWKL